MNLLVLVLPTTLLFVLLAVSVLQRRRVKRVSTSSITCPACDTQMTQKPTLSFLGFIVSRCPACSLKFRQPLPTHYRVTYLLLGTAAIVSLIANGLNIVLIVYLAAIVVAGAFDIQAVRRLAKRANNRMQRARDG